ncbi:MAG: Gfo/Idh/MocA family oxidoreductase [Nitrospirae bacterium]|nr:Gfo/Idh/MocA family oxidoreductase [Nitrospirota bacterium]
MINVAVIGYGYWGPNLVRNFVDNHSTDVSYVCDIDKSRLKMIKQKKSQIKSVVDYRDIIKDDNVQVVAIATPVSTHYKIAYDVLNAGKHVFIEKPMTLNSSEGKKLIELAEKKNLIIFVDHTFIYTGAVKVIKDLLTSNEMGDIYYFDSVRVNLGMFQHDINVIWDLAPHDFSIMDYLIAEKPAFISSTGASRISGKVEDIAYISLRFQSGLIAHLHVNWMSPVKIRKIIIGCSKNMIVFDDLNVDEKVKVYDKGVKLMNVSREKLYRNLVQYRIGNMYSPRIESTEALKAEITHLADCVINGKRPVTDGEAGLRVVKLLEAAQNSLRKGGIFVKI